MKTKLILGAMLAVAAMADAQPFNPNPGTPAANIFRTGKTGFGTAGVPVAASRQVEIMATNTTDDGLKITQAGTGNTALILDNTGTGGITWSAHSTGSGASVGAGNFLINGGTTPRLFIHRTTGNVGIGTTNPSYILDLETSAAAGGMRLTQSGSGDCMLHLDNNGSGQDWTLNSNTSGDLQVQTNGTDRFYVNATNGNFGIRNTSPSFALDVATNAANGGMRLYQSAGGDCRLHLDNGGNDWSMNATSTGNLRAQYNLTDRFFVDGSNGYFGIGTISPNYRLHVSSNGLSATAAGFFDFATALTGGGNGISAQSNGMASNQQMTGVDAGASCSSMVGTTATGVKGGASGADRNFGGVFKGLAASGAAEGVGVYGELSTGTLGNFNAAVWGNWNGASGANDWAGYFDGNVNINGMAYCTSSAWSSDRRFKQNIAPVTGISEKLDKLTAYRYDYKTEEFKDKNFPKTRQIGFIAQELKEVFPELIVEDARGYNYVNYIGMIPVLLQAIKEQQQQINDQKERINDLEKRTGAATGLNNNGTAEPGATVAQNEPNPFTSETVIRYTLPAQANSAYMAVYDLSGKQISKFALDQKGAGSITITSEKLAAGIYIYSIVADGKVMDSKRMIVADK